MIWRIHEVVFRLRSPMHIGCGKVGNLQRTRPYVTGRVLWGALSMRLARDEADGRGPATDSEKYRRIGKWVHESLAFTYFYPATSSGMEFKPAWPWIDESAFKCRFLRSYAGTALVYPQQSAAEGMLREVEYISPRTLDTGAPVFLMGYIFEREGCDLKWQSALNRLQLGGERGYGWGDVKLAKISQITQNRLFDGAATFKGDSRVLIVQLPVDGRLLAHAKAAGLLAAGDVEPLVGREWRSDNNRYRHAGQHVEFNDVCFTPGSVVNRALDFVVGEFGIWHCVKEGPSGR
jgi:hypothetical protein